jgi:hypothetical protein
VRPRRPVVDRLRVQLSEREVSMVEPVPDEMMGGEIIKAQLREQTRWGAPLR